MAERLLYNTATSEKSSLKNFTWKLAAQNERLVTALSQKLCIDDILARILVNRGIQSVDAAKSFLSPRLREILPDPFLLQDMDKAATRIADSIANKEKITVFADYDVDGASSAALLDKFFKLLGIKIDTYIPNRLTEGYGPNVSAMHSISNTGSSLLITVDCGTAAFEPIKVAKEIGLCTIIIDHHLALPELPEAYAIVNPNRIDDEFPYKEIAAVGVAFLVIIAVRKKLRERGWFNTLREPDLMQLLDLVALGTVCDVMPLIGINRVFVKHGLALLKKRSNPGLRALLEVANVTTEAASYHLGYVIGPRINAGGRVNESWLGVSLLTSDNIEEAYNIAMRMEQLNIERKNIENLALTEAVNFIKSREHANATIIFAIGKNWHIGVLGILASRIKERYNKPSAVISISNSIGKGSARSIPGIDLGSAISSAKAKGLLIDGGGHAMAGGFTIEEDKIDAFRMYVEYHINSTHDSTYLLNKALELEIDAPITISGITPDLLNTIERMAPFGQANPCPRFAIYNVKVVKARIIGGKNIMLSITEHINGKALDKTLQCMIFRATEDDIGQTLLNSQGKYIDVVGHIQRDYWNNTSIRFNVDDIILHT